MFGKKEQSGRSLVRFEDLVICELHGTTVAVIDLEHRTVRLDSGGFKTRATVRAMNAALQEAGIIGALVYRERGELYFSHGDSLFHVVDREVIQMGNRVMGASRASA